MGADQKKGALHAKMSVIGPSVRGPVRDDPRVVAMGSTNWTIASETNQEVNTVLEIGKAGAAGIDHAVRDMRQGASQVSFRDMQEYAKVSVFYFEDHDKRYLQGAVPTQTSFQRNSVYHRRS